MTIRNLDALFEPKSIALVGASNQPRSVGAVLARNLFEAGFNGPIMTVNPHEQAIRSTLNYRSVAELPTTPDLAVLATPPAAIPGLIADLGARGCRAAIVVTAGFGEGERAEGELLRKKMLEASRPHLLRIIGPNCLGVISPGRGINASFAHLTPPAGDLAFVTQSGAIATGLLDWASARNFGFSHVISLGDMADIDFGDILDYLALDQSTRAILLYVENITNARKFMSAGRIAARAKPVIVIKSGRSVAGARAAMSHTGALAGSDLVYDAAFHRAGMLRVHELRELFEAVTTLSSGMRAKGDRLAIITNGGGAGVIATDALYERGGSLANLSAETIAALDAALPHTWSRGNPVDILGDASRARYAAALEAVLADPDRDAVLVMNCPVAVADSLDAAKAVVDALPSDNDLPILTCWLGEPAARESRKLFSEKKIPTYDTPDEAVHAFMHLVQYQRNQELLRETPAGVDLAHPDRDVARATIQGALAEGRKLLSEPEAKTLLSAYGIPTVQVIAAADPAEAGRIAHEMGRPVVIKILSPDISHKSDVGGVRLDLRSGASVEEAAREMLKMVGERAPLARIAGFAVEEMVKRPNAFELLAGVGNDRTFGPILLFGHGGTGAEVIADRAIGLPPLNIVLAREMITRTRIYKLLRGYRDRPTAALDEIALTLIRLSRLLVDMPEVVELDINPLIADEKGVLALDARVVLSDAPPNPERLAIQPYPRELTRELTLNDGLRCVLRPIRPEDEPRLRDMIQRSDPRDVTLRFLGPLREFPQLMAARLSQIDYNREMALIATSLDPLGEMLGVSRLIADPDNDRAEFAVFVRSDLKGRGLGYALMTELLAYARKRGLRTIFGDVLRENSTMLRMAKELGFAMKPSPNPETVELSLDLAAPPPN